MEIKEFSPDIEMLFAQFMYSDPETFVRIKNILSHRYFDDLATRDVVKFLIEYTDSYSDLPTVEQIKAVTGTQLETIQDIDQEHIKWFLTNIERFCQQKAAREAVHASVDLIQENRLSEVVEALKKASELGIVRDIGTDYFEDPSARLDRIRDKKNTVSTGWKTIDEKLYGGFNRGELSIFAGQCVTGDTMVTVLDLPSNKATRKPILDLKNHKGPLFVSSPDGFVPVTKLINKGKQEILAVELSDGSITRCSPFHLFETVQHGFLFTVNLQPGMELVAENKVVTVSKIYDTQEHEEIYDLCVDHPSHRYYTNGVSSHNSGSGKSIFLQNLALNWALAGLHTVYISLELSEDLCSMRMDSMTTGYGQREIMKNIEQVSLKLAAMRKTSAGGTLQIKQMPSGSTANAMRAYLKEYEIQTGRRVDAVLVDYLDLCSPNNRKISPADMFIKDKFVSEELRNLAVEKNCLMISASQLNRSSHEENDFGHNHISGGISKINTADNVMAIFTTIAMKESGRYQLQFLKTRSSAGVGQKVDLKFDNRTLRISDLAPGEQTATAATANKVLDQLKKDCVVSDHPIVEQENANTQPATPTLRSSMQLRDLIKRTTVVTPKQS